MNLSIYIIMTLKKDPICEEWQPKAKKIIGIDYNILIYVGN